ncbi:ubiquinol-cytochrome c reductase iron-sulfur subunit [Candidatus Neomarinimicrobiota bacterium]
MTLNITRCDFMKLTSLLAVGAGGAILVGCAADPNVPLAPDGSYRREGKQVFVALPAIEHLHNPGTAVKLNTAGGNKPDILLLHTAERGYTAFANRCTHFGEELVYNPKEKCIECSIETSEFDLQGKVLRGPAQSHLLAYPCLLNGEEIIIQLT